MARHACIAIGEPDCGRGAAPRGLGVDAQGEQLARRGGERADGEIQGFAVDQFTAGYRQFRQFSPSVTGGRARWNWVRRAASARC